MAVVEQVERDRVVEVLGVVAVDGEDQLVPQVEAVACSGQIDLLRDRIRLLQHLVREKVEYRVFVQDSGDRGLHRAVFAQIGLDHALWCDLLVPIVGNRHRDAVAYARVAQIVAVDGDFRVFLRGRLHKIGVPALHKRPGQLIARALKHAEDGRLAPSAAVFALGQFDQNAVAVPRAAGCIRGDEQVVRFGLVFCYVRRDKAECTLGSKVGACHAAVMRADGKAVLFVLHDFPVRDQAVERILQLVFAGLGQRAADLIDAHGLYEQGKQPAFQHIILLHGKASSLCYQYTTFRVGLKGKKA